VECHGEQSFVAEEVMDKGSMDPLLAHSINYRVAVGPQAGRKVFTQTMPGSHEPFDDLAGELAGFRCTPPLAPRPTNPRTWSGGRFRRGAGIIGAQYDIQLFMSDYEADKEAATDTDRNAFIDRGEYYSNLIEGHDTHPVDIERALREDYSANTEKRSLQLEARAHIAVQRWIDGVGLTDRPISPEGIREIHRRFGALLPDALLWVEDPDSGGRMHVVPGGLRARDVPVGQDIAVSPGAPPRFLDQLERTYSDLGKATIIAAAAAHYRLLWIHPFLDGNGRVTRLMSHAMLLEALDRGGVWSIARGLARNVRAYKGHLAACDLPRRNDLDDRGNLSEEAPAAFTRFFLETCLDQVKFMEELVQLRRLKDAGFETLRIDGVEVSRETVSQTLEGMKSGARWIDRDRTEDPVRIVGNSAWYPRNDWIEL
jgi:Fic family protein